MLLIIEVIIFKLLGKSGNIALMASLKYPDFGLQTLHQVATGINTRGGIKQSANRIVCLKTNTFD